MSEKLILCTVDNMELAVKIARALVREAKAACVNIVPGIRSIYLWKGTMCDDSELLLIIKTSDEQFEPVRETIRRLHSYDTPEVIAVPITAVDPDYLIWLREQVGISSSSKD